MHAKIDNDPSHKNESHPIQLPVHTSPTKSTDPTFDKTDGPCHRLMTPPIHIPEHTSSISIISPRQDEHRKYNRNLSLANIALHHKPSLTPISGSLDYESYTDIAERIEKELNLNKPQLLYGYINDKNRSSSITATNELPLTELNLDLFTSEQEYYNESLASSTNELPLSDIKLKSDYESKLPTRSFSDPNILELDERTPIEETNRGLNYFPPLDANFNKTPEVQYKLRKYRLSPMEVPLYPNSFYPTDKLLNAPPSRSSSHPAQLSNALLTPTHSPLTLRSLSHSDEPIKIASPTPSPIMYRYQTDPAESGCPRRHRHSIAGQMSYIKMLGFGFGGPIGLKKMTGGSSNSLFSTAVISGSSSAPNLRDMIPSTASATGERNYCILF